MNDAQSWTLIAGFLAAVVTLGTMLLRTVEARIDGLRGELGGQIQGLRGELGGQIQGIRGELGGQIDATRGELGGQIAVLRAELNGRIDNLDRDVQVLTERFFGEGR
jgi:hypothetical protein